MGDTAQSYDSYMDTLMIVLDEIKPQRVFEWGTGKSTKVLSMYPSIQRLVSIEHDKEWFGKAQRLAMDNVITYQPDLGIYHLEIEAEPPQDLIFVDGKSRNECLAIAVGKLSKYSAVMLHDAARNEYESAIKLYPYRIWTDDGHTVTMTFNKALYEKLFPLLSDLHNSIGVKG